QALERLLERAQPEEPVLLVLARERDLVDEARGARARLGLGLEVRAARAVPALVRALVDVAVVLHAREDLLHAALVPLIGRADEEVVGDLEQGHERLEALRVAVGEPLRRDALPLGGQRHGLAVLVGARQEEHLLPALAHVAREDVAADRRVRVPEMRRGVDVVDRRGDVERHGAAGYPPPTARLSAAPRRRAARRRRAIRAVPPAPSAVAISPAPSQAASGASRGAAGGAG